MKNNTFTYPSPPSPTPEKAEWQTEAVLRTVLAEVHILICQVVVKQDEISEV